MGRETGVGMVTAILAYYHPGINRMAMPGRRMTDETA
jgi:hypothetical protein